MDCHPLTYSKSNQIALIFPKMKISIVIPAHNEARTISPSLQAITNQNYPDFEVIVVDNASIDNTREVSEAFPVKVIREERKGTMWACESGRRGATGEIISRMDADCLPNQDWLSKGLQHFKDPTVVMVSGPYDYHDASWIFRRFSLFFQRHVYPPVNFLLQKLRLGAISIGGNTFIRQETLEKMGGFNTNLTFYGDDVDTAKRASRHGKVVFDRDLIIKTSTPSALRFGGGRKKILKYWFHFFKIIFRG